MRAHWTQDGPLCTPEAADRIRRQFEADTSWDIMVTRHCIREPHAVHGDSHIKHPAWEVVHGVGAVTPGRAGAESEARTEGADLAKRYRRAGSLVMVWLRPEGSVSEDDWIEIGSWDDSSYNEVRDNVKFSGGVVAQAPARQVPKPGHTGGKLTSRLAALVKVKPRPAHALGFE